MKAGDSFFTREAWRLLHSESSSLHIESQKPPAGVDRAIRIFIWTADANFVPWTPFPNDMFAEDWLELSRKEIKRPVGSIRTNTYMGRLEGVPES